MQKDQQNELTEEIEHLRLVNSQLRDENEALRRQMYGSAAESHIISSSIPMHIPQDERYPSLPGQIDSATASPLSSDIVPGMSMAPAITLPTNSMPIVC